MLVFCTVLVTAVSPNRKLVLRKEMRISLLILRGMDTLSKEAVFSKLLYIPSQKASVAQLDAPSEWRPGRGSNPRRGRQHSFVDHEIFSTVILSLPLIQEGQLSRKNVHNTG